MTSYIEINKEFDKLDKMLENALYDYFGNNETYSVKNAGLDEMVFNFAGGECRVNYIGLNNNHVITLYDSAMKPYLTIRQLNLIEKKYLLEVLKNIPHDNIRIMTKKNDGNEVSLSHNYESYDKAMYALLKIISDSLNKSHMSINISINGYTMSIGDDTIYRIVLS